MKHLPNIFTLLNLFFGCCAIIFALQTDAITIYQGGDLVTSYNLPEQLYYASICIGIAGVIDFLDGFIARLLNATGSMGKQLDSLSDVVSFGVAPAMILYQFLRLSHIRQENGLDVNTIWLMPAFVFACAGAWRLARFGIDESQETTFRGVPIPAAGLLVASLPLISFYDYFGGQVNEILFNKWVLYGLILFLSYLMVSSLPMLSLKFKNLSIKSNLPKIILGVITIAAALPLEWLAVPTVFIAYILVSLAFKNKAA